MLSKSAFPSSGLSDQVVSVGREDTALVFKPLLITVFMESRHSLNVHWITGVSAA